MAESTIGVNFQLRVLTDIVALLRPVRDAIGSLDGPRRLLGSVGWDLDAIHGFPLDKLDAQLAAFADSYDQLQAKLVTPPETLEDFGTVLEASAGAVKVIANIGSVFGSLSLTGLTEVGSELVNLLAIRFISRLHPTLYQLLILLTLVQQKEVLPVVDESTGEFLRFPVVIPHVNLGHLADLIRDPVGTLKIEYGLTSGLTDPAGTADKLFPRVAAILQTLNVNAVFGVPASIGTKFGATGHDLASHMLTVFHRVDSSPTTSLGFGATFSLATELGLVVRPVGTLSLRNTLSNWAIAVDADVGVEGFAVSSTGVLFSSTSPPVQSADIKVAAAKIPAPGQASNGGNGPAFLLGSTTGTRLEIGGFQVIGQAALHPGAMDYGAGIEISKSALVLSSGDGDGFLSHVLPAESRIDFDFGVAWSRRQGLRFRASAGLELSIPVTVSIAGVVDIEAIQLALRTQGQDLAIATSANARAHLGPVDVVAEKVGLKANLSFPDTGGNLGPLNASLSFKAPDGIGISVNAGSVTGGGFITLGDGRYTGALELKIYSVAVKAFGVIETKLPGGAPGFSFAIVISAEFTPIQLGLGFTLNGVGGIIGINRRIDADGLRSAVRTGSLEHLLFPHDVIHDAPQIIHDLEAVLPATEGRYVFGPMAKIGWGTPTIIEAELGIILELPGPRLALLGEVHALLPKKDKGLVTLNLSIAGLLDFPKKFFAIDASLHDSRVGSFPITGDMAMRLLWGDEPSFALAVGGFNPGFQPPPAFPSLRRVAVDLGVSGNPSLTLQGYFAITSNTAQVGALAELKAHGGGIDLYGRVQFDAIVIFSPFSFEVAISAQVRISFHGHGIGIHLGGVISGPSPWRVRGEVCVSILWWDACLSFDKTFGSAARVELPSLDPWVGSADTPPKEVLGLRDALQDPRNWTPELPPAAFVVVTLSEAAEADRPIDPLGVAVVQERVCPLNLQLKRFGSARATDSPTFKLQSASLNNTPPSTITFLQEPFAPAQFLEMNDSQKLSSPSFVPMDGGIRLPANDNNLAAGSLKNHTIKYKTKILGATEETDHFPPIAHLDGMRRRSAAGSFGLGRIGAEAYFDRTALPRFTMAREAFVIGNRLTAKLHPGILDQATNKIQASLALEQHLASHPDDREILQVVPKFELGGS